MKLSKKLIPLMSLALSLTGCGTSGSVDSTIKGTTTGPQSFAIGSCVQDLQWPKRLNQPAGYVQYGEYFSVEAIDTGGIAALVKNPLLVGNDGSPYSVNINVDELATAPNTDCK